MYVCVCVFVCSVFSELRMVRCVCVCVCVRVRACMYVRV